jgi:LytS/YehU family sensor histidine kinase
MSGILGIFITSSIVKIGFIFAGITAFVLFQHWAQNERTIAQLEATTMRAELEQLQNQINPHFLFNMLNNILVLIRENPEEAVVILHKMSDMLKYQFNDSTKKEVTLDNDIHFLTDFLNLEKIRRDRFEFSISVENQAENQSIPPLLFIPFVENAVKHSADAINLSYIHLNFSIINNMLHFTCRNSKPLKPRKKNEYSGLGLVNIRRRLQLLYDEHYSLNIQEDESTYTVQLEIKI